MMPAMKVDFRIKGASDVDAELIRKTIERYNGNETCEETDFEVELDLTQNGTVKVIVDSKTGIISHDEGDREALIEQLVLLFSGNRTLDADPMDIMPIFERGCRFKYAKCGDRDFGQHAKEFFESMNLESTDLVLQMTNVDLMEGSTFMAEIDRASLYIVWQIVVTDANDGEKTIAIFV